MGTIFKDMDLYEEQLSTLDIDASNNELTSIYGMQNIFSINTLKNLVINLQNNNEIKDLTATLNRISSLTQLKALNLNLEGLTITNVDFLDAVNGLENLD